MVKYKSGKKSSLTEAHLTKVTEGKQITGDEEKGLVELYYSLSGCPIVLRQLN